jgi:Tfp pilus assembly protein PilF
MLDDRRRRPTRRAHCARCSLLAAVALLLSPGCAGWSSFGKGIPDVKPLKEKRGREAAKLIREQRDRGELQAARFAWEQGDLAGAQEMLERVLKRDPKHYEAGLLMAEVLIVQQQPDHARRQLAQLAASHPQDPRAMHAMGALLEAEEKPQEALVWFQRAARLAPDNQEYKLSCQALGTRSPNRVARRAQATEPRPKASELKLAEPKGAGATTKAAEAPIATASRTEAEFGGIAEQEDEPPTPAVSKANAARLVSARGAPLATDDSGDQAAEAPLPQLRPASESNGAESNGAESNGAERLLAYGEAALAAGARKDARGYFQRARRAAPQDAKIAVSAAVIAVKHDELEMAIEIVQDGLKAFPGSSGLYRLLGVAQYRLGDMQAAKASFEQSLSLDKSNPLSYFLMGSTLKKLGQSEAAEQYLLQARRLDPRYAARR